MIYFKIDIIIILNYFVEDLIIMCNNFWFLLKMEDELFCDINCGIMYISVVKCLLLGL